MSDLISRQDAKDAIDMALDRIDHVPPWVYDNLLNALNALPSVQPRKGKWIETEFLKLRECSCCHVRWGMYDVENFDFCPNCGSYNGGKKTNCGCCMEEGEQDGNK